MLKSDKTVYPEEFVLFSFPSSPGGGPRSPNVIWKAPKVDGTVSYYSNAAYIDDRGRLICFCDKRLFIFPSPLSSPQHTSRSLEGTKYEESYFMGKINGTTYMAKKDIKKDKTHFHAIDLDTFQSGPASSSTLDDAIQDQVCVSFLPQE